MFEKVIDRVPGSISSIIREKSSARNSSAKKVAKNSEHSVFRRRNAASYGATSRTPGARSTRHVVSCRYYSYGVLDTENFISFSA